MSMVSLVVAELHLQVVMSGIRKAGQEVLANCTTEAEKNRVREALKIVREHCENNLCE